MLQVHLTKNYAEAAKKAGWQIADEDILAAFIGNTCLGAENPKDGLFYLFIAAPNVLTYQHDGRVGSPSEPFEPQYVVEQ